MSKTVVLDVAGRVTIGHDVKLRESIEQAVNDGAQNILLDMTRVTKLDSSGVGELLSAHTSIRKNGGRLLLVGLSDKPAAVLQVTMLVGVLELFEDAETALAALDGG